MNLLISFANLFDFNLDYRDKNELKNSTRAFIDLILILNAMNFFY